MSARYATPPAITARRTRVHELRREGKGSREIADLLDARIGAVRNDLTQPDPGRRKADSLTPGRGQVLYALHSMDPEGFPVYAL